ncbi:hypothetical protein DVH05_021008 [Phytophthora capsici]|nr:hypothetical protein DVH05_021008 [Phytophthora capsici]
MFDEVLKFGAAIVDSFVNYEQPEFVYISPFAEQRGGAWAVVDRIINEGITEMYTDPQGRGGVLESARLSHAPPRRLVQKLYTVVYNEDFVCSFQEYMY